MIPSLIDEFLEPIDEKAYPSYTYKMILDGDRLRGYIDGIAAMRQAVYKRLLTQKGAYPIYSPDYGLDLKDLYGMPVDWVQAVLPDRIRDSLSFDDRITGMDDFEFSIADRHKLLCTFNVSTVYGDFRLDNLEVDVNV